MAGTFRSVSQVYSTARGPREISCSMCKLTRSVPVSASSSIECSIGKQPQTLPSCHLNVCFCARVCNTHAYLYHYSWTTFLPHRKLVSMHVFIFPAHCEYNFVAHINNSCITKRIRQNLQDDILVSFSVF